MGQPNNNNVVREVLASNGTITTVAGVAGTYSSLSLTGTGAPVASGVATAVALNEPKGLSVDGSGNIYFCDTMNQVIRKVSGGNISVVAGSLLQSRIPRRQRPCNQRHTHFPGGHLRRFGRQHLHCR